MPLLSHSPSSHMLHTLSSVRAYTPTFPILSYQCTTFFSPPFFSLCPLPPPFLYSPARPHLSPLPSALSSPYWFFRVLLLPFVRSGPFVPFPPLPPPSVAVMASERRRRKKRGGREGGLNYRTTQRRGGGKQTATVATALSAFFKETLLGPLFVARLAGVRACAACGDCRRRRRG